MDSLTRSALVLAFAPVAAFAQADPDSVQLRNDCRLAIQVLTTGQPAPKRPWASSFIAACGAEAGGPLADLMRRNRASADTALLNEITRPAFRLRDGQVFTAAHEIAEDRSASPQARVFAVRTLIWSISPGRWYRYSDLADDASGRTDCIGDLYTDFEYTEGAALPPDYLQRVLELAERLMKIEEESQAVKNAAICARVVHPHPLRIRK